MKRFKKFLMLLIMAMFILASVNNIGATSYTLSDLNSSAIINPSLQDGMYSWVIDGKDYLYKQWFWYRVGDVAEQSIDTLNLAGVIHTNGDFDPGEETLTVKYVDPSQKFDIVISYLLTGGQNGSNTSDIAETIEIHNKTTQSLDFHFFQYNDFDLGTDADNDWAQHMNNNTIQQGDSESGVSFAEVVSTPAASHYQIGECPTILNLLNDLGPSTLSDGSPIVINKDVTFAWEWDTSIVGNGSYIISKDKNIKPSVPEPSTLLLFGIGFLGLGLVGLRKKGSN